MGSFSGTVSVNLATFILLSILSGVIAIESVGFDFGTLALSSLKLLGDAHFSNGSVRLTRDVIVPYSGAGKVLYSKPIRFRQPGTETPASFSTYFSFTIINLNPSSIGGGLAFVISPDDESLGDAGGFLGVMDGKGTQNGFVAIEFDTSMDAEFKDINGDHIGLDLNSMVSAQVCDLETIEIDLKSGNKVNSWIDYTESTRKLNVYVSYSNLKPKSPCLSMNINLEDYVNEFMFVGFSGSTQGSTEIHSIDWWSFSSSFDNAEVSNSSTANTSAAAAPPPPPPQPFMAETGQSAPPSMPPIGTNNSSGTHEKKTSNDGNKCHNKLCKRGRVGKDLTFCTME